MFGWCNGIPLRRLNGVSRAEIFTSKRAAVLTFAFTQAAPAAASIPAGHAEAQTRRHGRTGIHCRQLLLPPLVPPSGAERLCGSVPAMLAGG